MSLATIEELGTYTKNPDLDIEQGQLALDIATSQILSYTHRLGWSVQEDEEVTLDGSGSSILLLPDVPVTDVSEITEDDEELDPESWEWSKAGIVSRIDGGCFQRRLRFYVVTYSHGEAPPAYVKGICLAVAARAVINPEALSQEGAAGYTVSYGFDSSRFALLTDAEKVALGDARL